MRLERQHTAERVNHVLNHPKVRPWIAPGDNVVDISAAVANTRNVLLMGEHGGVMFFYMQSGIYECHTQVLPEARGQWTSDLTLACVRWMFTRTPAYELVTRVPHGHIGAKAAALERGFVHEFTRPKECLFMGRMVDVGLYRLSIHGWVTQDDTLLSLGDRFHQLLHREADKLGIAALAHKEDENHNRYVGAAWEMLRNGQPEKGCSWYNRWAIMARHAPVKLVPGVDPVQVQIDHGMTLLFRGDDIEAVRT